jgi:SAM-dependent methyltransferase
MNFSPEWDHLYRANAHMSVWPWSDLVSYVHRYAKPTEGFRRVLELGCGAGANIPFFLSLGVDYSSVEGSSTIVAQLREKYPELTEKIVVADFTEVIPFGGLFDLVVDRGSLTHNTTEAIRRTLTMVFGRLRSGGKFLGIHWFSADHQDAGQGKMLDSHTRTDIVSGHLARTGAVHFFDQSHLVELLTSAGFSLERLEHRRSDVVGGEREERSAWWHFVAVKP